MKTALRTITMILLAGVMTANVAWSAAPSRIKTIAKIDGVRENQLLGYGLVVGLAGTGDGVDATKQTYANMLERMGLVVDISSLNTDNVAAVLVTANLPAFVKSGDTIDIVVSSVGDANSLKGGTLVMTPLRAADGRVYAVAQGPITIGGWSEGGAGGRSAKGHPTVARMPGGAIVEREVVTEVLSSDKLRLSLNNPDFTTADNIVQMINDQYGEYGKARAMDAATVEIIPPDEYLDDIVPFIAMIESLQVEQDQVAKIIINEKTGTIVMGLEVTIDPVVIAHGPITVKVKTTNEASQPGMLSGGSTLPITNEQMRVDESKANLKRVMTGDLVDALNRMKVSASDIIAIFQALKASGALQAELEII